MAGRACGEGGGGGSSGADLGAWRWPRSAKAAPWPSRQRTFMTCTIRSRRTAAQPRRARALVFRVQRQVEEQPEFGLVYDSFCRTSSPAQSSVTSVTKLLTFYVFLFLLKIHVTLQVAAVANICMSTQMCSRWEQIAALASRSSRERRSTRYHIRSSFFFFLTLAVIPFFNV